MPNQIVGTNTVASKYVQYLKKTLPNCNIYLLQLLLPGGSGYFTCKQNMKLVTNKFKSGRVHEKHVVATWNPRKHLSICFWAQGNQEKPVSRWPVAGPSGY